jgi:hypothetical protein
MAGWRLSRRGRIITMADRYQDDFSRDDDYDRGAIRMPRQGRERSAGRTGAADRPDRPVRRMGRANLPVRRAPSAPAIPDMMPPGSTTPPAVRRRGCSAPGRSRHTRSPRRITSRVPCIRCTAMRAARPRRAGIRRGAAVRRHQPEPIRRAMTMRCMARSNPAMQAPAARAGLCGRSLRLSGRL